MGLDATVACYLTLKGADGLPLVEDLFLKTKQKEEFTDIFSVVMALRFIGQQEQSVIPRDKIVAGHAAGAGSSRGWPIRR